MNQPQSPMQAAPAASGPTPQEQPRAAKPAAATPETIASRKGCSADGMGLSHYIMMKNGAQ